MSKAKESQREDSVLRGRVKDVLESQYAKVTAALVLIDGAPYNNLNNNITAVRAALVRAQEELYYGQYVSETYIGNKAAFELGDAIMEKEFKK